MKKGQCLTAGLRVNGIPIHSRWVHAYLRRLCSSCSAACIQKGIVRDSTWIYREPCTSNVRSKVLCVSGRRHRPVAAPATISTGMEIFSRLPGENSCPREQWQIPPLSVNRSVMAELSGITLAERQ